MDVLFENNVEVVEDQELKEALRLVYKRIWQEEPNLKGFCIPEREAIEVLKATVQIASKIYTLGVSGLHAHETESYKEPTEIMFHINYDNSCNASSGTLTIKCTDAIF
ncbi:hypothetical protein IKG02_02620 [Candidatus Saccharibacteria bacterium]|nr:hypothetical protein [Candidatus Saccharibacteria bacterium]